MSLYWCLLPWKYQMLRFEKKRKIKAFVFLVIPQLLQVLFPFLQLRFHFMTEELRYWRWTQRQTLPFWRGLTAAECSEHSCSLKRSPVWLCCFCAPHLPFQRNSVFNSSSWRLRRGVTYETFQCRHLKIMLHVEVGGDDVIVTYTYMQRKRFANMETGIELTVDSVAGHCIPKAGLSLNCQ